MNSSLQRLGVILAILVTALLMGCAVVPGAPEGSHAETVTLDSKDPSGNPIKLKMILYLPPGNGPFDVMLYAHGGPIRNKTYVVNMPEDSASPFLKNNIAVAFLIRQGRGGSEGDVSLPGCVLQELLVSLEEGMKDMETSLDYVKQSPLFMGKKVYTVGSSQGGMLAATLAARHPDVISKAVAFAPGWIATGYVGYCSRTAQRLQNYLFTDVIAKSTAASTLFIHANNDSYHPPASVFESFRLYKTYGGTGVMKMYPDTHTRYNDGHFIIHRPDVWEDDVTAFLGVQKPVATTGLGEPQK